MQARARVARFPRWMWIGLLANVGLWALAYGVGTPVGTDLIGSGGPSAAFDIRVRFDGPEHVLLGREIGGGTSLLWFILRTLNAPALLAASGRRVEGGMTQLNAPLLAAAASAQWIVAGIMWFVWRGQREAACSRRTTR
jgi:hypothetical protein